MTTATVRLLDGGAAIELRAGARACRFHAIWLLDNARDETTHDAVSGQRLVRLLDLPADPRVVEAGWHAGRLRLRFAPDGRCADYDPGWLLAHGYDRHDARPPGWTESGIERWDAASAAALPVSDYAEVGRDDGARLSWLRQLRRFGFARLRGVPAEEGAVARVAALFGFVRETNYGRLFDVRAEADPLNLAYTRLALPPHTDNPYRDPVPGVQLLHCLRNAAGGGETRLVDGFAVAARLQAEAPDGFRLLAAHRVRFAYAAGAARLEARRPVVELAVDGELVAIHFNDRSVAPFDAIPFDATAGYYAAYRRFAELIEEPALGYAFRLEPGELVAMDNRRALHGRSAFTDAGDRWLQGCYVDRDGLLSTIALLAEREG